VRDESQGEIQSWCREPPHASLEWASEMSGPDIRLTAYLRHTLNSH
jgi:hypothetical protein